MILTICASRKAETGLLGRPSAVRSLLSAARQGLQRLGLSDRYVDFASLDLPPFEGASLESYDVAELRELGSALRNAPTIIFGVPAYWGGASGIAKNFLDLTGGGDYGTGSASTDTWSGKRVNLLVVGAAPGDARRAREQLTYTLGALGAAVGPHALAVDRPAEHDPRQLMKSAFAFGVAAGRPQ
jgi:NAD(P)H-dependent FMN reductase